MEFIAPESLNLPEEYHTEYDTFSEELSDTVLA